MIKMVSGMNCKGDYYIPCLILPTEEEQIIGIWGQRHLHYLKEYHRLTYINLLTSGRLNEYLAAVFVYMTEKSKIYGIILKELFFKTSASKNVLNR